MQKGRALLLFRWSVRLFAFGRFGTAAVSLSLVLVLSGCASLLDIEKPTVTLAGFRMVRGSILEQEFAARLRVGNPNDFPIELDGLAVTMLLNDKPFARGMTAEPLQVKRMETGSLDLTLHTTTLDMVRQIQGLENASGLDYALEGHVWVKTPRTGRIKVDIDETGSLDESW